MLRSLILGFVLEIPMIHSCHAVTASKSHSEPQSYRKSHEKAPDKTEKVSAEVKV